MLSLCGKEAKFFYLPQRHQDAKLISVISFKGFCFEVVCHTELVSVSNENRKFKPYRHISWIVSKYTLAGRLVSIEVRMLFYF